ncbi:sulfur oxidation c-type cytochrome SoxX [Variovorax paradoxus]|jgi:sulfur-oxidizing protein SoxX|uniref:sulfur oxidation c-type cytochrome SoxX n=1 Tax=Variovorax TaxID=34072 RepID=UPI0006E4B778|nr:sulfur oxidation c-type cytochrome SoxX [Variovorax sp. CY25R-8]KPU96096.1 sulfur oxidation c-type cytochrome SoxX [Variovorax paradoxus]KPV01488.1 sulfur oxidation c-type cytochrome SoxX [Variovorax paradoxus]KPV09857.1 sulfur oxidation c-type cytochrome SoxX [Variovorax paradoxus]KPV19419.1 sulfur oxidation c-type cytochrome SoxX [Variovorax paradoxus]KPV29304.1 sulfur oxidation c-type cytochrome SoxX [Variovorax paradoxus]
MNADHILGAVAAACALALFGCASADSAADIDRYTAEALKSSFRDQGIAKVDRLVQDPANRACSEADASGKPLDEKTAKEIEAANMKTIRWPADGRFVGDWREGEKIAQNGRGLTWTDAAASAKGPANGGNCYNCHQMSKEEISFGTLGPSLYQYGKLRGVSDPAAAASKPIVEYTWGKLWNARAYNACSNMPRVGHSGILDEAQIRDVMGLLLDPKSPVNR